MGIDKITEIDSPSLMDTELKTVFSALLLHFILYKLSLYEYTAFSNFKIIYIYIEKLISTWLCFSCLSIPVF